MQKVGCEWWQLEYVVTAIEVIVLIFFQCVRAVGLILHGSWCVHLSLLFLFDLAAMGCVKHWTVFWAPCPCQRLPLHGSRTKPWLWTPEASTVVAALLGWDGWNDIPLQVLVWVWMSRDLAKTLSHFFSCLPVWIAIFSNPAGPGVFSPLQHSHSWAPCLAKHQDPLNPV